MQLLQKHLVLSVCNFVSEDKEKNALCFYFFFKLLHLFIRPHTLGEHGMDKTGLTDLNNCKNQ